jgi:glycosyltransferase involved in cell wall biosynthesis
VRIALVSDAWTPQVNGVVRTLRMTVERVRALGHHVEPITPDQFTTLPCPSYPEIRLALRARSGVARRLETFAPDAVHIATEGPLGWAARRWCLDTGIGFTTSFHTRFPDYLAMRTGLSADWFWPPVRRFHAAASRVFAATPTLERELAVRGLPRTHRWTRGVDVAQFHPDGPVLPECAGLPRPLLLHVGRVAVEKNIGAFLDLDMPGSKMVVGDGPALATLRARYPEVRFTGALHGERLAAAYRSADALVFPSRTDTFGLVIVEALASGLPVAALPVPGPADILTMPGVGALDEDLTRAVRIALTADRAACVATGRSYDWSVSVGQFLTGLCRRDDAGIALAA